ncbi:YeeE/YedE family protein [Herminiimonas aquatilis]|uniref:DUF6691 family protein n=1 Tax=Herminiimonas aquatilis TaxID=345342 RepID=A0ABW2J2L6_9BURK
MQIIMASLIGLIFGLGLIVSGMADPSKVLNFLDLSGDWDPSLAFVMGGAIIVGLFAFRFASRLQKSLLGEAMRLPTATNLDRRLIAGSLLFGIGWGLGGYCPGPALVSLTMGNPKSIIFIVAMLAGMMIFEVWERRPASNRKQPS